MAPKFITDTVRHVIFKKSAHPRQKAGSECAYKLIPETIGHYRTGEEVAEQQNIKENNM